MDFSIQEVTKTVGNDTVTVSGGKCEIDDPTPGQIDITIALGGVLVEEPKKQRTARKKKKG